MRKRFALAAGLLLLLLPTLSLAQTAVLPVSGANLSAGEQAAVGMLMADVYGEESRQSMITPARVQQAMEAGQADAQAAAASLGASTFIQLDAARLDERVRLQGQRLDNAGRVVFSARITAHSLDDLEPALIRLARALWREQSVEETRDLETVTKGEATQKNRLAAQRVMGVKTSGRAALAKGLALEPMIGLHFNLRFEGDSYFIEFGVGAMIPTNISDERRSYGGVMAELGASYYLYNGDISPYIGLGIEPRLQIGSIGGGVGLAPYGQVGAMFFRSSRTRLYTEVRVSQNVVGLRGSTISSYPTEVGLNIGIGW